MSALRKYQLFVTLILTTVNVEGFGPLSGVPASDICNSKMTCDECVLTVFSTQDDKNKTCTFVVSRDGVQCQSDVAISEAIMSLIYTSDGCKAAFSTPAPPINGTTTAPTTTFRPVTNRTTTTSIPKTSEKTFVSSPSSGTTDDYPIYWTTTTNRPTTMTPTAPPKPAPRRDSFAWIEFLCGITFASFVYIILCALHQRTTDVNARTLMLQLPASMENATVKMSIQNECGLSGCEKECVTQKV